MGNFDLNARLAKRQALFTAATYKLGNRQSFDSSVNKRGGSTQKKLKYALGFNHSYSIFLENCMQNMSIVVHDPRHQLAHGLAEELTAIRARPDERSTLAHQIADIQRQSQLLPRRNKVRRGQRLTCALEMGEVGLIREMQQGQFWLFHDRAFEVVLKLTGFLDSEPSVRPAVSVVSTPPPAAVFLSSSPDDRIDGA
ncbi:hypothetical protein [Herbaspirillum huttiense]|uniref:Uncharacterized protein n=2 Tax=Herbaspirillum huttiense TaxID=863372 RepID=A0AAJ2LUA3_9BURK|nr:hypothetical protein [Herbaspirillum huttiense]MDR9839837.1 hypothetical protein [Herbaspirillum huttiense]